MTDPSLQSSWAGAALTDDEVLAVAARHGSGWASPLPSLVGVEGVEIERAVVRGWRSLLARELVEDAQLTDALRRALNPALEKHSTLHTFPCDADGVIPAQGTFMTVYSGASGLLVEVTSGSGIHRFVAMDIEAVIDLVSAALESVLTDGIDVPRTWPVDAPRPRSLCAASGATGQDLVLEVNRGSFRLREMAPDGERERPTPTSIREGVATVLDHRTSSSAGVFHV